MEKGRRGRQHFLFDVLIGDWSGEEWDYWLAECCQMWEIFEQRSKELRLPRRRWTARELLSEAPESVVLKATVAFSTRFLHTRTRARTWNFLGCNWIWVNTRDLQNVSFKEYKTNRQTWQTSTFKYTIYFIYSSSTVIFLTLRFLEKAIRGTFTPT